MAKTPEEISDPRTRSYCVQMAAMAHDYRVTSGKIVKFAQDTAAELEQLSPVFRVIFAPAIDALKACATTTRGVNESMGRLRMVGFDARNAGKAITDNPHVQIIPDLDGPYGYSLILTSHEALSWYSGWKMAARAGEDLFPD